MENYIKLMNVLDKDTIATQILYDINVGLEENYAEPDRQLFPFLQPHYSLERQLPFQERFLTAWNAVTDDQRLAVKRGVEEALRRCGAQWLGLWRGLEVFDLQLKLGPEFLSTDLLTQLLCLRPNSRPEQRAIWLDLLLARWKKAGINPDIPPAIWRTIVQDVNVDALIDTLSYLVEGPLKWKAEALDCLDDANKRLDSLIRAGSLTPNQIVDLPHALQDLYSELIPSFRMPPSKPVTNFPDFSYQRSAEADALLKDLDPEGYMRNSDEWSQEVELACEEESELEMA